MSLFRKRGSPYQWYDFSFGGQRYRGSTKLKGITAARHFEGKLIQQLEQGEAPKAGDKSPTLEEFLPRFLTFVDDQQQHAKNTKRSYRNGARLLSDTKLRHVQLTKITTAMVATVQFPGGPSNGNQALRTLSRILSFAVEQNFLRVAPRIKLFRETGRELTFTPEWEAALLQLAPQPLRDVFQIMRNTGMRPEEVFRMRKEDILWEKRGILVPRGKSRASRRFVGMSAEAEAVLRLRAKNGSDWVFPSRKIKSHITTVAKAYAKARKLAGLPDNLVLYCSRHSFATEMIAATGNDHLVAAQMGHSSTAILKRYVHPSTAGVAEIMDGVNERRGAAPKQAVQ